MPVRLPSMMIVSPAAKLRLGCSTSIWRTEITANNALTNGHTQASLVPLASGSLKPGISQKSLPKRH